MSTTTMLIAAVLLVLVHVVVVELQQRARLRQVRESCERSVADQVRRLELQLEEERVAGHRKIVQLKRCRETLREVLGEIEVLG